MELQAVETSVADPVFLGKPDPDPNPKIFKTGSTNPLSSNKPCNSTLLVINMISAK